MINNNEQILLKDKKYIHTPTRSLEDDMLQSRGGSIMYI